MQSWDFTNTTNHDITCDISTGRVNTRSDPALAASSHIAKAMNIFGKYLLSIFALFLIDLVVGHPQCLDYLPPFGDTPCYCSQYRQFSCCTNDDTAAVKQRVSDVLRASISNGTARRQCRRYLRNVACTVCSPYAAHVYEAETADSPRILPSLCQDYCLQFYNACYPAIFSYYNLSRAGYDENSGERFCRNNMPSDKTYCYPSVIQGPQFGDDTTDEVEFGDDLRICALPITSGLRNPTALVHSNDQTGRLFVTEQIGVIHVITKDRVRLPTPFLDITDRIHLTRNWYGEERGLVGIVFHPNFKENGKFYIYYSARPSTRTSHDTRVSQFLALNGSNVADRSSEQIVMTIPQPQGNHNGGQLLFEGNDTLLIFLGDGGGQGDRHGRIGNGLDRSTLMGSLLRINVSSLPYTIPKDNPFVNNSRWRPEIYAYGLRNPWKCSFDRGDSNGRGKGRLFCGDVGQNRFEEIDIIVKGGNYGWRAFEGNECYDGNLCNVYRDTAVFPIHAYPHAMGRSVTGGFVYRGCSFPKLQGLYIFGDFERGTIWGLREQEEGWNSERILMGGDDICHGNLIGRSRARYIISFGEDENGELYMLATHRPSPVSRQGVVYQIIEPERRASPSQCSSSNN